MVCTPCRVEGRPALEKMEHFRKAFTCWLRKRSFKLFPFQKQVLQKARKNAFQRNFIDIGDYWSCIRCLGCISQPPFYIPLKYIIFFHRDIQLTLGKSKINYWNFNCQWLRLILYFFLFLSMIFSFYCCCAALDIIVFFVSI